MTRASIVLGVAGVAWLLAISPVSAGAPAVQVDTLTDADLDGTLGDCGMYLHREGAKDALVFADTGTVYMRLDGKVVHLLRTSAPADDGEPLKVGAATVDDYAVDGSSIRVQVETRITGIGVEYSELDGTIRLTQGDNETRINVKGGAGC